MELCELANTVLIQNKLIRITSGYNEKMPLSMWLLVAYTTRIYSQFIAEEILNQWEKMLIMHSLLSLAETMRTHRKKSGHGW